MWVGITVLLSRLGGWATLSDRFRATEPPTGDRFHFVSGSMGAFLPVNYGSCLTVTVNERGFHLAILLPFRLGSPPLFIPWSEVASIDEKRFLFTRFASIRVRDAWPEIRIRGRAGERIRAAHAATLLPPSAAYR